MKQLTVMCMIVFALLGEGWRNAYVTGSHKAPFASSPLFYNGGLEGCLEIKYKGKWHIVSCDLFDEPIRRINDSVGSAARPGGR